MKNKTYETRNIKTQADKKADMMRVTGKADLNKGLVSCETQIFARSIAGVHNAKDNKRSTKNPNGRKAARVALRKGDWD